jgi:hypothetical protein
MLSAIIVLAWLKEEILQQWLVTAVNSFAAEVNTQE